jgi:drug/metabolite transporter (DMT)-like permease
MKPTAAIVIGLLSAALFGAATPASKLLLGVFSAQQLAGLLYLGAALAVAPTTLRHGWPRWPADRPNRIRLVGAILFGGLLGPILLLLGLRIAEATSVSLWLNVELAATAVLGTMLFREHLGALGWIGVVAAVTGAIVLSGPGSTADVWPGLLVAAACVCWGLDNNLTSLIDGLTPSQSTFWKGLVAGTTNLAIGIVLQPFATEPGAISAAVVVGALAYGASIALYITSAQALGATRSQIVFSTAPFFGVVLSVVVLGETLTIASTIAGALFVAAIVLFAAERHSHIHRHETLDHEHPHRHDDGHHEHAHPGLARSTWHSHRHHHDELEHSHAHVSDLHHRHGHD